MTIAFQTLRAKISNVKEKINERMMWVPRASQTLAIPRKEMPQIISKDMPEFMNWAKANRLANFNTTKFNAKLLKATQKDFNKTKIFDGYKKVKAGTMPDKPILISKDYYVVDGHHRWLAYLNADVMIPVFQASVNIRDLIDVMNSFPKTFHKDVNESFENRFPFL